MVSLLFSTHLLLLIPAMLPHIIGKPRGRHECSCHIGSMFATTQPRQQMCFHLLICSFLHKSKTILVFPSPFSNAIFQDAHKNRGMEPFYTCDVQSQNAPSCVMGGGCCCCTVSRAAARRAEQGCQRIQGEEEEGESAQRHAGAIQHAASAASSCGYVQHAHIRLQRGRLCYSFV